MNEALYDTKVTCLYCDGSFQTKKTRSGRLRILKKDEDFCNHYDGENPYFYEVNVCPNCSFAFTESFSALNKSKRELILKEYIEKAKRFQLCDERDVKSALTCFKLALLCATVLNEKKLTIAGLCLKIAWLNRYQKNIKEENRFLQNALDLYEQIYQTEDLDRLPVNKSKFIYLMGELNGRLGNYEMARKWFGILLTEKDIEPGIKQMTRERWLGYKESKISG